MLVQLDGVVHERDFKSISAKVARQSKEQCKRGFSRRSRFIGHIKKSSSRKAGPAKGGVALQEVTNTLRRRERLDFVLGG